MGRIEDRKTAFKLLFSDSFGVDNFNDSLNEFTRNIFFGVKKNEEIIDKLLKKNIKNWKFERISRVAKCAMRIGIYEMLKKEVPIAVVVNESVEIAKMFGSKNDADYVQAVLSSIVNSCDDCIKNNDLSLN